MGRSNSEPQDGIHKEIQSKEEVIYDSEHGSEALVVSTLVSYVVRGLIAYSEELKDLAYSIAVENTIHPQ